MSNFWRDAATPADEATWALGRFPDRTYLHRSFRLNLPVSRDYGQPARWVVKVFDEPEQDPQPGDPSSGLVWTEEVVRTTRRSQLKVQIAREAGEVRELVIQRVTTTGGEARLENVLSLDRDGAGRLIDVIRGS
jgi:hypothetical protein